MLLEPWLLNNGTVSNCNLCVQYIAPESLSIESGTSFPIVEVFLSLMIDSVDE